MGLCYQAFEPHPSELQTLPGPAQALIASSQRDHRERDRGNTRAHNDRTVDSRGQHFRRWLVERAGFTDKSQLRSITQTQAISLLSAYLHHVIVHNYTIHPGDTLMAKTLRGYVHAAFLYLNSQSVHALNMHNPHCPDQLHPSINDPIAHRSKWQRPKEKREPYTELMFLVLHQQVTAMLKCHSNYRFHAKAWVLDLVCLGAFTGHRGNESIQTTGTQTSVSRAPQGAPSGDEAGNPLAFMLSDWEFYDAFGHLIVGDNLRTITPHKLRILYRFDKTKENFKW